MEKIISTIMMFLLPGLLSMNLFALGIPTMSEETKLSGIEHQYRGGWHFFVGGGVAAFDCNQDVKPELFIAGGSEPSKLFINQTQVGGPLEFTATDTLAFDRVTGAYAMHLNADDLVDLVVLRHGENIILQGLGDCQFERVNERLGIDGGNAWTTAFAATWESEHSLPTLVFGNYIDETLPGAPFGTCADHQLYRPGSNDTRYAEPVLLKGYCSLAMLFTDWNRNGQADLRSANDRQYYLEGYEQLWDFSEFPIPREYDVNDGWQRVQLWGMGIAHTDLTGDGLPEYFVTSMADNKLTSLMPRASGPEYEDLAYDLGVTAHRPFIGDSVLPSTAWHAQFADVNNDTFDDLFIVKGNVEAMTDFAQLDPNNLFLGKAQGHFEEAAIEADFLSTHRGRGGALVDLNLDGLLDAVVVNREENVQLWRNLGDGSGGAAAPMGNWIQVQIEQPGTNSKAIGAWIEVRVGDRILSREVTVGGGHVGNQVGFHHFGLGVAERAQLRVRWPDGTWSSWIRLFANQFVLIEKGATVARVWMP